MKRVVIASHGKFATGLKETLKFITTLDNIYDIPAYAEDDSEPLEETIAKLFATFSPEDKVIVMTDVLSGSVNQKFFPYINDHTFVITGVNVPLALSVLLANEEEITPPYIRQTIEESKQMIVFVNEKQPDKDENDE
ncbi:PTS sorbitol transporter subunit IIB [Lachnospiraceae bacterium oral taxon 500]|nr:PTS sorbitol transporter subunit IIB [Lachnospiraceae bacterium oral taxon 500]